MGKNIKVKQHDITDCAAACLASVSAHYGLNMPIAKIRQMASTDKKGTNVLGLLEAAEKLHFSAKGVRGDFESLSEVPKPTIAHVIVKDVLQHFVVIYKVTKKYIEVMDPADGKLHKLSHEKFKKSWTGVLVLIVPDEGFETIDHTVSLSKRLWFLIKPHRFVMLQALIGAAIFTILGLSTSIYVQKIVDNVLVEGNKNLLNLLSIAMIAILFLQLFIGAIKTVFTVKTGQLIDARLILGYYKHLLKLPQQFFDSMRTGEIISRVNDAVKIRAFINDTLIGLVVNVFTIVFAFAVMFAYYWKLALIMALIIPFYSLLYVITNKLNKATQRKLMENSADLESQLVESLNSVRTIKSFGLEAHSNLKTETRFVKLLQSVYKSALNTLFSGTGSTFLSRIFTIILLWSGSYFVIDNIITPGELLSFYALIAYFTGPVSQLVGMNKTLQDAKIAADRLFELMDLEKEDQSNQISLQPHHMGDITFEHIKFRYGSRATVFEDLNMSIPKGKVTALVGESGSGKTSLIGILQKLYPYESGSIKIGKFGLQHIDNDSLRKLTGVVPQHIDLFAGTVIENITVGDYNPDLEKVVKICTQLGILEFIESLPHGFNTHLGENGTNLSGGQKQRIAIARALYKEPEILILDEATSALDSQSEKYVQKAINLFADQGKTVIVIAHRLSTVCHTDKIIVLSKGQLVEEGNHEDLMQRKTHYYNLWKQQFPMLDKVNGLNQKVQLQES